MFKCINCDTINSDISVNKPSCRNCGKSYRTLGEIIDFRDESLDETAAFDFSEDFRIATILFANFDQIKNFNAMVKILEDLQKSTSNVAPEEIGEMIKLHNHNNGPQTASQLVHGDAILKKLELYTADAGTTMPAKGRALEDGCGHGYFINGFSKYFEELFVLDFSMCYLMLASKIIHDLGLSNVTLVCASAERLPFTDNCFDFVHSNNVIEHVKEQQALILEANRVLKVNAMLFILSPNRFSIYFEPHYGFPCYGFIPKWFRKSYIRWKRNIDIDDVALPSLGELKSLVRQKFPDAHYSFVPSTMSNTVTGGKIRSFITLMFHTPVIGGLANLLINRIMLPIMPYHTVVCVKSHH